MDPQVCVAGFDVGSFYIKAMIVSGGMILAESVMPSKGNYRKNAGILFDELTEMAGVNRKDIQEIGIAGLGSANLPFEGIRLTEISCLGKGTNHWAPFESTIIDFGALGSRVASTDSHGRIVDFEKTDKCAAGGGRVLEVVAKIINLDLQEIGNEALEAENVIRFESTCPVFAESEAISLVADGQKRQDILAGVHRAVSNKIQTLVNNVGIRGELIITGGGALNAGLVASIEARLGNRVFVPPKPQFTIALGAALTVMEQVSVKSSNFEQKNPEWRSGDE